MKYFYILVELLFFIAHVYVMPFFSPFFEPVNSSAPLLVNIGIYFVFGIAPIALCLFILVTIFYQFNNKKYVNILFGWVVFASLVLLHSWGMRAYMLHSFIASIASILLVIFGLIKIRSLLAVKKENSQIY